jgi:hypothetical protein
MPAHGYALTQDNEAACLTPRPAAPVDRNAARPRAVRMLPPLPQLPA